MVLCLFVIEEGSSKNLAGVVLWVPSGCKSVQWSRSVRSVKNLGKYWKAKVQYSESVV